MHNTHPTHGKTESELQKPRLKKKKKKGKKKRRNAEETETPDSSFRIKTKNTRGMDTTTNISTVPMLLNAVRFLITNRAQKVEHGKKMKRSIKTASNLGSIWRIAEQNSSSGMKWSSVGMSV